MAYSKVDDMKTYVIKMKINCECDGCQGKLEGYRKILGVKSVDVDDEEKKVTISIIGDPKKVVEKLKKQKKTFELIEQTSPIKKREMQIVLQNPVPEIKKQEMQIMQQNPVPEIHDRRVVAQQPGNIRIFHLCVCLYIYTHVCLEWWYCITQMVHEAWTNGDIDGSTDDFVMALEKMDLKPVETKNRNGGSGGNNIWRTISIFISTIAACLLGDPTGVLVPLFLGFFFKSIPKLLPKLD